MTESAMGLQISTGKRIRLSGFVIIFAVLVLPSMIMTVLGADSMAAGLALGVVVLIVHSLVFGRTIVIRRSRALFWLSATLVVLALVLAHGALANELNSALDWMRLLDSLGLMGAAWLGSGLLASWIAGADDATIDRLVLWALGLLAMNATLGLSGVILVPHATFKASGYFSEPSHLAIAAAPFLVYVSSVRMQRHWLILGAFFAWGIAIQNLTMLIVIAVAALPRIKASFKTLLCIGIVIALLISILMQPNIDADYFRERLTFGPETNNQSVLVFLRGWEYASKAFEYTDGVGLGFQQFGSQYIPGEVLERLESMGSGQQNQFDGGTVAAKIVGELGVFGVSTVFIFAVWSFQMFRRLRSSNVGRLSRAGVFFASSVLGISVEMFARGIGYFSPGMLLLMSSISAVVLGIWPKRK